MIEIWIAGPWRGSMTDLYGGPQVDLEAGTVDGQPIEWTIYSFGGRDA